MLDKADEEENLRDLRKFEANRLQPLQNETRNLKWKTFCNVEKNYENCVLYRKKWIVV